MSRNVSNHVNDKSNLKNTLMLIEEVLLKDIEEKIKELDFEKISGSDFINKMTGHYAHLELEISKTRCIANANKFIYDMGGIQFPAQFTNVRRG